MEINVKDSNDLTARQLFSFVFEFFQAQYPNRDLRMDGSFVEVDGERMFNIEGHNLLTNLSCLTMYLEDEL